MIKILINSTNVTIGYAAKELKKYLDMITGVLDYAVIEQVQILPKITVENEIALGLLSDFDLDDSGVLDPEFDDLEDVKIVNGSGYIAGSNSRSILFGVYDYLKAGGCAWPRPGMNGEKIVNFDPMNLEFTYRHLADARFRGECIEGAVAYEHVRATIVWAPKVHMNFFRLQYPVPSAFMGYWYHHFGNTRIPPEELDYDTLKELTNLIEKDAARCGLILGTLGHGYPFLPYNVNPVGINGQFRITEGAKKAIALVNGKREFQRFPSYTQICMGNDEVLKDQANWIADFCESKPHVTIVGAGLGDAFNNHCECPLCTPHHPSDLYVKMLNMIDEELTRRNLNTKVAFSAYVDTLWAPREEKFNNPDRFILSTAISGRDYNKPYDTSEYLGEIPKWERNNYNLPPDFSLRRKMYDEWKKIFSGANYAFEYHFYTMHFNDPSTLRVARNYYEDLHQLKPLGMQGIVNCQTQRIAFPSAFHVALCGEALFDLSKSYEELETEYFKNAFEDGWEKVHDYLTEICETVDSRVISDTVAIDFTDKVYRPKWFDNKEFAKQLETVPQITNKYRDFFLQRQENSNRAIARAYKLLCYHCDYCDRYSRLYYQGAIGDIEKFEQEYDYMLDWLSSFEMEIQYEFDLRLFKRGLDKKLEILKQWIEQNK